MILGSQRRAVHGILFAFAAIAGVVGAVHMSLGWSSWASVQTFIPFGTRFWAWAAIAALPLAIAAFKGHWGLIPQAAAIATAVVLPWCRRILVEPYDYGAGGRGSYTRSETNLAAYALMAVFAIFMIVWGMRQTSRALVNLGIVYFGLVVGWFYFSNILDKVGRSLGLIGLGVLFLAGGWGLEMARRRLLARMDKLQAAEKEAV
jgi:hypothetical protein